MKVGLVLTTWEKNLCLPNVLESIKKQQTSFPLEVYIFDDCSSTDPEPIVNTFLPEANYKRSNKRVGGRQSRAEAIKMVSPDIDILFFMSSEIILLEENIIEEACKKVELGTVVNIAVKDVPIDPVFYKKFDENAKRCLNRWDTYKGIYSGSTRAGNWLFAFAQTKKDFYNLEFHINCCDRINQYIFQEKEIKIENLWGLKAIHQSHSSFRHSCPSVNTCRLVHIGKEKYGNCT